MQEQQTSAEAESVRRIRKAKADGTLTSAPPAADPNGSSPPKPQESKADRFVRLARQRMPKFAKAARHLANLANKGSYDWNDEQRQKLLKYVNDAVKGILDAFTPGSAADGRDNLPF